LDTEGSASTVSMTGLRCCAAASAGVVIGVKYALVIGHVGGRASGSEFHRQRFWCGPITRYRGTTVRHPRRLFVCEVLGISCHRLTFQVGGQCCADLGADENETKRRGFLTSYGQEGRRH